MALRLRSVAVLLALCGLGCAPRVPVETVVSPDFSFESVEGVAVLPLFEWGVSLRSADSLTAAVADAVRTRMSDGRVIAPDEAARLIGGGGLAYEWALFLHDWEARDELDRTAVMRVADLLGVDLLIVVDLPEVARQDGSGQDGPPSTVVVARVRAFSGASGILAWYGSAGLELVASPLESDRAPPVMDAAAPVVHAILRELPRIGSGDG
jgi:hypothetical protein